MLKLTTSNRERYWLGAFICIEIIFLIVAVLYSFNFVNIFFILLVIFFFGVGQFGTYIALVLFCFENAIGDAYNLY